MKNSMEAHEKVLIQLGTLIKSVDDLNIKVGLQNGSVAKHEARLATQDVLNAQMTITQQQLVEKLASSTSNEMENSTFRIKTTASIDTFKWLVGLLGIGNIILISKVVLGLF